MRCSRVQEEMAAYVAGESESAGRIRTHLETCAACRAWQDEVRETARLWAKADGEPPGLNVVGPVLRRLAGEASGKKQGVRVAGTTVFLHYGVAASITVALFRLGVFESMGWVLMHNNLLVSAHVQVLFRLLAKM